MDFPMLHTSHAYSENTMASRRQRRAMFAFGNRRGNCANVLARSEDRKTRWTVSCSERRCLLQPWIGQLIGSNIPFWTARTAGNQLLGPDTWIVEALT